MSQMIAAADCFFWVALRCNYMTSIFRKSIMTKKLNEIIKPLNTYTVFILLKGIIHCRLDIEDWIQSQ